MAGGDSLTDPIDYQAGHVAMSLTLTASMSGGSGNEWSPAWTR